MTKMKGLTSLVLLAAIGGANLQCFTPNDDFQSATYSTDLSGITDFGLDLYKRLSPGPSPKNFFFSAYSIWSALTLAYFGSGGNTQRQLEATLRVSDKVSTLKQWKALEKLYKTRQQGNATYTFDVANRAFVKDTLQLRPCIENLLQNELHSLNFNDATGSANFINNFVNKTTRGRISKIIGEAALRFAVMVLVNAVYFKGTWKYQFDPQLTRQRDFFINPQDKVLIAMMSLNKDLRYGESKELGARVLELPYSGDEVSMFVLLPSSDKPAETRFENMVNNLNGTTLRSAIDPRNMGFNPVNVRLPKFTLEKTVEGLATALKDMGIVDIFDENRANLTSFAPIGGMYASGIAHKSFVEVNEEGTEAAAATANLFSIRTVGSEPKVIVFHCNEPFIFLIHDNETKNVLFMGAIKDPRTLQTAN